MILLERAMPIGTKHMTDLISAAALRSATLEDLRDLNRSVVEAIRALETSFACAFLVGDRVKFTAKDGRIITGSVAKINMKTIKVRSIDVMWAVSPSLLTLVERADWAA